MSYWFRLDNQAKIFKETYSNKEPHVFRVSFSLNEDIDKVLLQEATNKLLTRFPMYKVRFRRGFFWMYLDKNNKPLHVKEMDYNINKVMSFKHQNNYLIRVLYKRNTLALESFHTLTDGTGLLEAAKSLIYEYLLLKGYDVSPDNMIKTSNETSLISEQEDSSLDYYDKKNSAHIKESEAFRIKGTINKNYSLKLISAILNAKEVKQLSKEKNVTISTYLVAVMGYSIYKTLIKNKHKNKPYNTIKIGLPVNLRTRFSSTSQRNFVNIINVDLLTDSHDYTFEDFLKMAQDDIKKKTTKEELTRIMSEYVSYEKNIFLKLTPSILKSIVLKIAYLFIGSTLHTMSFSNLGLVKLPSSMEQYINDCSFMVSSSLNNPLNCGIVTIKDKMKISFTSQIAETNIQKEFIRHFTTLGLKVELESNYLEDQYENM